MKMNNMNDRNMDKDMRELTPEELEQIEGGGMKEILAAVTLAAMTATSPVATGLAEELTPADDTTYEQADFTEEETVAAEEDMPEEVAEMEEVVEELAEPQDRRGGRRRGGQRRDDGRGRGVRRKRRAARGRGRS